MTEGRIHIPKDHPHFEGHFPGSPVLPAVSQIQLVLDHLRASHGKAYRVKAIRRGKFRAAIQGEIWLDIEIQRLGDLRFRWILKAAGTIYSMGDIEFYGD